MVAVPVAVLPVTIPVVAEPAATVATSVLLLLHVQLAVVDVSVVVLPWHTERVPVNATGCAFTRMFTVVRQPGVGI